MFRDPSRILCNRDSEENDRAKKSAARLAALFGFSED
jgi:hypothetical protein